MKKKNIYINFDDTICHGKWTDIGSENEGSVSLIKRLIEKGHLIFLNTNRINCEDTLLNPAKEFLNEHFGVDSISILTEKKQPKSWDESLSGGDIFIDILADGIPLREFGHGTRVYNTVHMHRVSEDLVKAKII